MSEKGEVRVELESQVGTSHDPARVRVYQGDQLVTEIVASIDYKQGADGRYHSCVILTKR